MTQEATKKLVAHIMRLLKVIYIDFPVGRTNKGNLALRFSDQNDFEIMLDSVPLSTKDMLADDNNIALKEMIKKYWFDEQKLSYQGMPIVRDEKIEKIMIVPIISEKKKGRPKGSKNKK